MGRACSARHGRRPSFWFFKVSHTVLDDASDTSGGFRHVISHQGGVFGSARRAPPDFYFPRVLLRGCTRFTAWTFSLIANLFLSVSLLSKRALGAAPLPACAIALLDFLCPEGRGPSERPRGWFWAIFLLAPHQVSR